jgi:hypothetical protein
MIKKHHALHNEAACDFLLNSKQFNDWVVTTAFYSAIHFVHNEIFPLKEDGKVYQSFDSYFSLIMKKKNSKLTKHTATIQLVKLYLSKSVPHYRWLFSACMNARYSNYVVSNTKAKVARDHLSNLKKSLAK